MRFPGVILHPFVRCLLDVPQCFFGDSFIYLCACVFFFIPTILLLRMCTFCKLNVILAILLQCKCGFIETQRPYLHGTSAAYSRDFRVINKFHHISVPYKSFRYFPMNVCANQHQASSPFSFVSSASPARQPLPRNRMPKGHLAWVYARARAIWQRNDRLLIQTEHYTS